MKNLKNLKSIDLVRVKKNKYKPIKLPGKCDFVWLGVPELDDAVGAVEGIELLSLDSEEGCIKHGN